MFHKQMTCWPGNEEEHENPDTTSTYKTTTSNVEESSLDDWPEGVLPPDEAFAVSFPVNYAKRTVDEDHDDYVLLPDSDAPVCELTLQQLPNLSNKFQPPKVSGESTRRVCPKCNLGNFSLKFNTRARTWFWGCSQYIISGCRFTCDITITDFQLQKITSTSSSVSHHVPISNSSGRNASISSTSKTSMSETSVLYCANLKSTKNHILNNIVIL